MNIYDRIQNQDYRRIPTLDRLFISEASEKNLKKDYPYTAYIINAMRSIDKKYTDKLIEQGNRVENQLKKRLEIEYPALEFERQGSVSNNTHIKYSSDVDVLVIIDKFVTVESSSNITTPYKGNLNQDLLELRTRCVEELKKAFPETKVDDTGANSVEISGGSLACKVDAVPSNWYDTDAYYRSYNKIERGIEILNKKEMLRKTNYPFKFNYLLDQNDRYRNGVTRMLIRLLKTIKVDSDKDINFSSYDISSIVYRMPNEFFQFNIKNPIEIMKSLLNWMLYLNGNYQNIINQLKVVDDSRLIFDKDEKVKEFGKLYYEVIDIVSKAESEHRNGLLPYITESHLY